MDMNGYYYRVREGETLFSLSHRFRVPPVLLARENGLTAEPEEGDILYLPPPPARTYRVGVTDTEETLSARFHRPAKEIFSENGIEYLFPFLVLSV